MKKIVGIPYGTQCFKFAVLSFAPFGKDIEYGGTLKQLSIGVASSEGKAWIHSADKTKDQDKE